MFERKINLFAGLAAGAVGGLAGAWVKAKLEGPLQAATDRLLQDGDADVTRTPHGVPPVRLVEKAAGHKLGFGQRQTAKHGIHYAFSATMGALYGALAEVAPPVTAGNGAVAGVALWLGAHEAALPLLGLAPAPKDLPASNHIWEGISHIGYGMAVETVRTLLRPLL